MRPTLLRAVAALPLAVALVLAPAVAAAAPQAVPGLFPTGVDAARAPDDGRRRSAWRVAASTDPGHPARTPSPSPSSCTARAPPAWTQHPRGALDHARRDQLAHRRGRDVRVRDDVRPDGFQPGTARLSIELASDDNYEVLLNGVTTTVTRDGAFTARRARISAGFRAGANVLPCA